MKHLKTYDEHLNESWREKKIWLYLPSLILDKLFSKILNLIPHLNFKYKELAAKVDTDLSLGIPIILKTDPIKLKLEDIQEPKLKKSLMLSGLLDKWNIYFIREDERTNSKVIYITKDELTKGDTFYGSRLGDKELGEIYVVVAKRTEEHEQMEKERKIRYNQNQHKRLEKDVEKIFKYDNIFSKVDDTPIFFKCVLMDRKDLVKKILDFADKKEKKGKLLNYEYVNSFGNWYKPLYYCISLDMFKYLYDNGMDFSINDFEYLINPKSSKPIEVRVDKNLYYQFFKYANPEEYQKYVDKEDMEQMGLL